MKNYMRYNDDTFDGRPGKIYLFDFNKPNDPIKELAIEGNVDLVNSGPHGIGLWEDKKGVLDTPTADTYRQKPNTKQVFGHNDIDLKAFTSHAGT